MRPFLACDADLNKVTFPIMVFPKIDGVRALSINSKLVARSGKPFKNKLNTTFFSNTLFDGFDGEMVLGLITGDHICNATTSALSTIEGAIATRWCLFDYVIEGETDELRYIQRYTNLLQIVEHIYKEFPEQGSRIWVIPFELAHSVEQVNEIEQRLVLEGYEGAILRDQDGLYKYGRGTAKEANYLRLKRFVDSEIVVTAVIQGQTNNNEKTKTPNGYAERATHAENMVPNGMVGTIIGKATADIIHNDKLLIKEGEEIEVAPGKMSHNERLHYFEYQDAIIGKLVKFQFFPVGIKDKLRFPTFQCFRDEIDL